MASQSQIFGGRNSFNSFIARRDKGKGSHENDEKILSLKQRVEFLDTSFKEYKESIAKSIKESKEEILTEMRGMIEKLAEQKPQKAAKNYRRKVPTELAVSTYNVGDK